MSRKERPLTPADYRHDVLHSRPSCAVYLVRSRSEPETEHTVMHTRRPDAWGCTCPATVRCAHIDLVAYEEAARVWRAHWAEAPDLSLVLADRELASRSATLTADERLQWETCGDELARRALSLDAVSALLASPGTAAVKARGRAAVAALFGEG